MKKIWFNILIFFGCFLLLVTTLGAVLIIAPGMELLGIMYIRSTSGSVSEAKSVANAINYDTIQIESNNIPVYIEFVQSFSMNAKLVESYNGFAKAGETPTVEISTTDNILFVKSNEYKPVIGHSRDEESGLFVKIPMYYTNNIVVNSSKSAVKFSGQNVTLNNIEINAKGAINFNNNMQMHSLVLNFGNKDAVIQDSVDLSGTITASSKSGSLTVPAEFTGALNFKSSTGDLIVGDCGQLTFKSNIGQIRSKDKLPAINGDANIDTSGSVEIGSISGAGVINTNNAKLTLGEQGKTYNNRLNLRSKFGKITMNGTYTNSENLITSKSGDIAIEGLASGVVTTTRGDVSIKNAGNIVVTSSRGDIEISECVGNVEITTTKGDVTIGEEGRVLGSAIVTTTKGSVEMENVVGAEYIIQTKSGDISIQTADVAKPKLTIISKNGDVGISGDFGETSIKTNGEIDAEIEKITKPMTLEGKNKDVIVQMKSECYYNLTSKKNISAAPGLVESQKQYNTVPENGADNVLSIQTGRGEISVIVK